MFNRIGYAAARLKNAQIECKDGIQLIKEHNDPDTLIYCDPPISHQAWSVIIMRTDLPTINTKNY